MTTATPAPTAEQVDRIMDRVVELVIVDQGQWLMTEGCPP
jgi:hypothetical protein